MCVCASKRLWFIVSLSDVPWLNVTKHEKTHTHIQKKILDIIQDANWFTDSMVEKTDASKEDCWCLFTFNEVLVFLATLVYRKKVDQKLALALNVVRHPKSWVTAGGDEKWWFHQWTWWFNENLAKENDDSTIFRLQQFL